MIKANELRIDNWVYDTRTVGDRTGLPKVQTAMQIQSVSESAVLKYFDPIPLTPEILKRCGFKNRSDLGEEYFNHPKLRFMSSYYLPYKIFSQCSCYSFEKDGQSYGHYVTIEYLHQMQNLYFALTGEELIIQL